MLAAGGCIDPVVTVGDDEPSGAGSSTSPSTTASTSGAIDPDTRGTTTTTASDATTSTNSTGAGFIPPEDLPTGSFQCSILLQDCPPGHKCAAHANDGGGAWNAAKCIPIAEDPAAVGEPCHVEEWEASGIDDCELGAICWHIDSETLEGRCVAYCIGAEEAMYCENPEELCTVSGAGAVAWCEPLCNPLEQDCPEGHACYPIQDGWSCAPDASGDIGAYGDPCEFINVCDPGLICLDASTVPPGLPCEGAAGCCTEVCDITDPLGDLQCAGAAEGQTCQPWYEEGTAPVVVENVGACALPP